MAKYGGGHEDLNREIAETNKLIADVERLAAAEASEARTVRGGATADEAGARASRTRAQAKREAAEVEGRAARATKSSTDAVKMDTAAIKANTEARQRANRVQSMGRGAVAGARSPQYNEAYRLMQEQGSIPSQYRLRQIQGVGQRRAAAMVQAMQAGLVPSSGQVDINRPLTRLAAAHDELAATEYRLAQASEEYGRVRRKGTEDEAKAQYAQRESIKAELKSRRSEVVAAEGEQVAAMERNRAAIQADTEARQRVVAQARRAAQEGLAPRGGLLGLPAPGQTVQGMPVGPAQTRTRAYMPDWSAGANTPAAVEAARLQAEAVSREIRGLLPAVGQTVQGMPVHQAETRTIVQRASQAPGGWTPGDPNAPARASIAHAQALAAEAEAQGRLNDAARIYAEQLNNPARAAALEYSARTTANANENAAAYRRTSVAYTQAASSFYPLNQAMHRHGALTSEFIAAAARGEVTLREMGNQAAITAGKFAGWTVAATGVYGLVGALQQVGAGAQSAASGADQAFRVINERPGGRSAIQGSFADLSKQFNVPIETAADAVYRMGQVFHDQDAAVKAAEASLLSYKTGEVSVEDSTKNLIAIQRAFGLSSGELVSIFDQINQAQNTFGVSIANVESGLAKAGGTWKNAGGDLSYLLAIMVAVQKATGESGNTIGTAMSRLYYVQHPQSAQNLRDLGVDVDTHDAQKTFQSLMKQAQAPGADIQALASGFAGNQYARLFTGMLKDQRTFNDALRDTSAEASKGAGMRELSRVLDQVDEQISQLGNGLQRIGEELGRSGAFTFFGLMLKAMNGVLGAAEGVLSVFNLLPGPLKTSLMLVGQMALAITALRRLGATERFANTRLGFLADPAGRQRTHAIVGLREGASQAANRAERFGQINVDAAHEADVRQRLLRERERELAAVQHLDPEDVGRKRVESEYNEALLRARSAEGDLAASTRRLDASREIARHAEDELSLAQRTSRRQFQEVASQRQWVAVNSLDQPNTRGVTPIVAGGGPGSILRGGGGAAAANAAAAATAAEARTLASTAAFSSLRAQEALAAARVAPAQMNAALASWGAAGTAISRGASTTARGARTATTAIRGAATGMRGAMASLAALGAALGPLDLILIAAAGIYMFKDQVDKLEAGADRARDALTSATRSQAEVHAQIAKANSVIDENLDAVQPRDNIGGTSGGFLGPIKGILNTPDVIQAWWNNVTGQTDAAQAVLDNNAQRIAAQEKQRKAGKAIPQLTYDQLSKNIEKDAQLREQGLISQREFDRRMANHAIEARVMLDANAQQVKDAQRAIAQAATGTGGETYGKSLLKLDTSQFQQQMQGTAAAVDLYGLTPHNIDMLKQQYEAAEQKYRNSRDPEDLAALSQARQTYFQAVIGEVNKELQVDLLQAPDESSRRAAYTKANESYDKMRITFKQQNDQRQKQFKQERDDLKRKQKLEDQGGYRHMRVIGEESAQDPSAGTYDPTDAEVQKREDEQRKARIKLTREQRKKMNAELARQNRELTIAQLQLKQAAYEDRQQGRDVLLNLQISQTRDPQEQARLRLTMARRQVQDAEREWGTKSRQYRQALTELNNARNAQADAVLRTIQADNALLLARAGDDPVKQAQVEAENTQRELDALISSGADPNEIKQKRADLINNQRQAVDARNNQMQELARLRGELAAAQAGGDPVLEARAAIEAAQLARQVADTPVERLQALVDLAKANNQLRDAIAERERARFDLLKSQTDDPVEQARLDMEAAKAALSGTKGIDRTKKQADYNNARRAWQQSKIDATADDINFQLQMDQITNEEAAKQLEALANIKGISKAKKRELLLQAKQLRDEASGDYELDVGSVKMPTLYEVRRFVTGGMPTSENSVVTDNRVFTVNLQTAEAVNAFAQQLELTNGTSAKSTARSMLMR